MASHPHNKFDWNRDPYDLRHGRHMDRPWKTDDEICAEHVVFATAHVPGEYDSRIKRLEEIVEDAVLAPARRRREQLEHVRLLLSEHLRHHEELEIISFARQNDVPTDILYEVIDEFEAKGWLRGA